METDISILRKSGHFYFALTRIYNLSMSLIAVNGRVAGPLGLAWLVPASSRFFRRVGRFGFSSTCC